MWTRSQLDDAFPTLIRYTGWAGSVALLVGLLFGHPEVAPGFVATAGMILYKTVKGAAENGR